MPDIISLATAIDKSNVSSGTAYVALMEVVIRDPATGNVTDTIRLCNNNEDITYAGNVYTATIFDLTFSVENGEVGSASVSMNDYNGVIRQSEEDIGGVIGFSVRIMIINSDNLSDPPDMDIDYKVVSSQSKDWKVSWSLGSESALSLPFPKRKQYRDRCRFRYKGPECGYTGGLATCDLSLDGPNGCAAHANTIHFGGFVGIKRAR